MKKYLSAITLLLLTSILSFAQTNEVKEIKITSSDGWASEEYFSELIIKSEKGVYLLNGIKLDEKLVDNLLKSISETAIEAPKLINLGITQNWLNKNFNQDISKYWFNDTLENALPTQRKLYIDSFKNTKIINKVLPNLFSIGMSDYYPEIAIEVIQTNGRKIKIDSDSQTVLSLPWNVTKNGKTFKTYNANISKAITKLMPEKTANKRRLNGEDIAGELASTLMDDIKTEWDYFDVENKAGKTLRDLKKKYSIKSVKIDNFHSLEFGEKWVKGEISPSNLHAILEKTSFPQGYNINLTLPYLNQKVENFSIFQQKIDRYQTLVFSIDWLRQYSEANIQIRFVNDKSFNDKALKIFVDDMNKIGKGDLVEDVKNEQENIALVLIGKEYPNTYWLVLPNKKMILWRYGVDSLIKWKKEDFDVKECSDYNSSRTGCVGAVISPNGNIISK